jgi:hypothetical protein
VAEASKRLKPLRGVTLRLWFHPLYGPGVCGALVLGEIFLIMAHFLTPSAKKPGFPL